MPDQPEVFDDIQVGCVRVEQQTAFYCGAACCEMFLRSIGVSCSQSDAYKIIHDDARFAIENMYSDPEGMALCLNKMAPSNHFTSILQPLVSTNQQDIVATILYTLKYLKVPVTVLVQRGNHWVVVDSLRLLEQVGANAQVTGVFVQNPWYGSPDNRYVAIDEFLSGWLTLNQWGKTWKDKLIAISDDQVHGASSIMSVSPTKLKSLCTRWLTDNIPLPLLTIDNRISAALVSHGFIGIDIIKGGGTELTSPISVVDLDSGDIFIIAPRDATSSKEFTNFVYVAVDAKTYSLLEIAQFSRALQIYTDDEAKLAIQNKHLSASISILPGYVWMRTYDAMSRFQVARNVVVDGVNQVLLSNGDLVDSLERAVFFGG